MTNLGWVAAAGVALGWTWADPAIGLLITVAILMVLRTAGRDVFACLMDAVDPELTERAESALAGTPGVTAVTELKLRWIGHHLHAEGTLDLQPGTEAAGGAIAAEPGDDCARRSPGSPPSPSPPRPATLGRRASRGRVQRA